MLRRHEGPAGVLLHAGACPFGQWRAGSQPSPGWASGRTRLAARPLARLDVFNTQRSPGHLYRFGVRPGRYLQHFRNVFIVPLLIRLARPGIVPGEDQCARREHHHRRYPMVSQARPLGRPKDSLDCKFPFITIASGERAPLGQFARYDTRVSHWIQSTSASSVRPAGRWPATARRRASSSFPGSSTGRAGQKYRS